MLLASLMMATACSEDEPAADGHEQTTPGEDGGEEGNEGSEDGDEGGSVDGTNGRYLVLYCSRTGNTESMAQTIQSFLHSHADLLAGKRIALFASSVSSLISTSERDAASLVPDATFEESMLLTSSTLDDMGSRIPAWLEALGASREDNQDDATEGLGINIIVGDQTITATMEDNGATRDFLSRLPLEVTLEDYNNVTEKIFYPDPELSLDDTPCGCTPVPGDITIYEPWGNVAIFCRDWTQSNSLIKIGHIDDNGIETFNVPGDITVRFERR